MKIEEKRGLEIDLRGTSLLISIQSLLISPIQTFDSDYAGSLQ